MKGGSTLRERNKHTVKGRTANTMKALRYRKKKDMRRLCPCQRDEYTQAGDSGLGLRLRAFGVRLQGTFGPVDRRRSERSTSGLESNYRAGLVMAITFLVRVGHLFLDS